MKVGAFLMPNHPVGRDFAEGHYHNLEYIAWLDEVGYEEAWVGCHYTVPREPNPAPDLLVAQALTQTKNIRISPGGYMLPYHHPAELAHRIAWLDHISKGRCYLGIGSGSIPSDWALFNIDGFSGENRRMMEESLDIMIRLWTSDEEEFEFSGEHWQGKRIPGHGDLYRPHIRPLTKPYPQIAIAGFSASSPTLEMAGQRGFIPLSLSFGNKYLTSHWEAMEKGAAAGGRTADRDVWRIGRDVYIADTDAEAKDKVVNGIIGEQYREFWLPVLKMIGMLDTCKHHPDVADSDVTVEYMVDHNMLVGSAETVKQRLEDLVEVSGGFGTLLATSYDHIDDMDGWRESKRVLIDEIIPKFA
ncbi:MAG: LLM class flavin-dependent oxidoreductase [Alphaproteobacteria bacterium]|jgi:alkanesulfonate monooxygenase SsuD/methylene tetrahydromethanopterin reductase-like flavin-dependent oxidoreductase (luciferase family)|nr:LLM class flavin-dependent oxidoreductase [Alphaproteobacteria bacterium]